MNKIFSLHTRDFGVNLRKQQFKVSDVDFPGQFVVLRLKAGNKCAHSRSLRFALPADVVQGGSGQRWVARHKRVVLQSDHEELANFMCGQRGHFEALFDESFNFNHLFRTERDTQQFLINARELRHSHLVLLVFVVFPDGGAVLMPFFNYFGDQWHDQVCWFNEQRRVQPLCHISESVV